MKQFPPFLGFIFLVIFISGMFTISNAGMDDDKSLFKKALMLAKQGDAYYQFCVGGYYRNGTGVDKDYEQAIYWMQKSAEQGYFGAQSHLAYMYYNGKGVQRDIQRAYILMSVGYFSCIKENKLFREVCEFYLESKEKFSKELSQKQLSEAHAIIQGETNSRFPCESNLKKYKNGWFSLLNDVIEPHEIDLMHKQVQTCCSENDISPNECSKRIMKTFVEAIDLFIKVENEERKIKGLPLIAPADILPPKLIEVYMAGLLIN